MCKTTQLITALVFSTHLDTTIIIRVCCHNGAWGQSNYKVANSTFFSLMYLLEVLNGHTFRKSKPKHLNFWKVSCYENSLSSLTSICV